MLLTAFLAYTALGFGIWILGHLLYMSERSGVFIAIAAIGAVIIMATGGMVALDDVEQQTGKTIENEFTEAANVSTANDTEIVYVNNESQIRYSYDRISLTDRFGAAFGQLGLGGMQMIVGGLLMIRDLEEVSF